jgi:ribosomal-protein-alanine N-acetyltransferase
LRIVIRRTLYHAAASSEVAEEMRIETEHLLMREFRDEDWPVMAAYWADPRYQRHYREVEDVQAAVRELIGKFVAGQGEEPRRVFQLAIVDRDSGRLIGNCGVRVNDAKRREGNIGYELNPEVWGRGYATEAARAMLRFGFEELGLHRIWAGCVADNVGSWRVMEKVGMRREAHFREFEWYRGRWWDTLIYAVLEREWRSLSGGVAQRA